jgi:Flp pilus assembly protein TadG
MTPTHTQADHRKSERGSIIIMTAIGMLLLLLMVGLCIDVSRIYGVRAELQNAADAAALTAAVQLNGGNTGINLAVARATEIVNTFGVNSKSNVPIIPVSVTFAVNLYPDSGYMSAAAATTGSTAENIRFVKVVTNSASTGMLFASSALGADWIENRQAVAGNSGVTPSTICDFFPAAVALADPSPTPGTTFNLSFNQGTGTSAVLNDQEYIILEIDDITGNGNVETALLTAGLSGLCKTIGGDIHMTPSSNSNNGPRSAGDGANTRFNEYANGYANLLQPGTFHPDFNIQSGITHQNYLDGSPITSPSTNTALREAGRRLLIMPIILPNGPPGSVSAQGEPLTQDYPAYTANIKKWGLFFLRNRSVVIQGGGCDTDPLCGDLQVEVIKTVGAMSPVVPTATSSSLTLPVIYR